MCVSSSRSKEPTAGGWYIPSGESSLLADVTFSRRERHWAQLSSVHTTAMLNLINLRRALSYTPTWVVLSLRWAVNSFFYCFTSFLPTDRPSRDCCLHNSTFIRTVLRIFFFVFLLLLLLQLVNWKPLRCSDAMASNSRVGGWNQTRLCYYLTVRSCTLSVLACFIFPIFFLSFSFSLHIYNRVMVPTSFPRSTLPPPPPPPHPLSQTRLFYDEKENRNKKREREKYHLLWGL